ncbi:MAG: threonine synthase, partial [Actinobacteria bacterium]|nr:threonine synthase [Actinomycetota bacterium]
MSAVTALRCRVCEREQPLEAVGTCPSCFGPLDPIYDWEAVGGHATRAAIEAGPRSIWRYAAFVPVDAPPEQRLAPGLTPLVPAPRRGRGRGGRA